MLLLFIGLGIFVLVCLPLLLSARRAPPIKFLPLHDTKKYVKPIGWKGTPCDRKHRFVNHEYEFYQNYLVILFWFPSHFCNLVRNWGRTFPVLTHSNSGFLNKDNSVLWLGHASFLVIVDQIKIIIDPQFYNTSIYIRHSKNPIDPQSFIGIDYILLSHDHADHCDKRSLQLLVKNNPAVKILAGMGMDNLLCNVFKLNVQVLTAEWYEQYQLTDLDVWFVPTRHYGKRAFKKFNSILWGGFMIRKKSPGELRTIFFGGDSGYGSHYKDLKTVFKPDLAILGVGAYKPHWFLHPNHMSPFDAIKAFADLQAISMIPMHYGTFNLSNELMDDPVKILNQHNDGAIKILIPGGAWDLNLNKEVPIKTAIKVKEL